MKSFHVGLIIIAVMGVIVLLYKLFNGFFKKDDYAISPEYLEVATRDLRSTRGRQFASNRVQNEDIRPASNTVGRTYGSTRVEAAPVETDARYADVDIPFTYETSVRPDGPSTGVVAKRINGGKLQRKKSNRRRSNKRRVNVIKNKGRR